VAQKERKTFQARIERLGGKGDLEGAIAASLEHLEKDPEDRSALLGLGELYFRGGRDEEAIACYTRVADHYQAEGFHSKAVALYRKIVRIRRDDHALLSLTDLAAQEGRLVEAREHLMALEKHRRERGDERGADECLASLDALIAVRTTRSPAELSEGRSPDVSVEVIETEHEDAATRADAEATGAPVIQTQSIEQRESPHADFGLDGPDGGEPEAAVVPDAPPRPGAARSTRRTPARGRTSGRAGGKPAKPLQTIFNELRARARDTDDATIAHERFDLAQYHLRDGNEDAAMTELREAAKAPVLRFTAAAQLGRLLAGRNELEQATEWLERAAAAPPVTPDEGLAVLYELADALQRMGEPARALAVFMELQSQRRAYRDVAARIAALSAQDTGDPDA
jgi:tetratricopeptide (TPR) repeat protein